MDQETREYIDSLLTRQRDASAAHELYVSRELAAEQNKRYDEMFRSLVLAAQERDLRYEQRFQAAQTALTAAMAAQEKAVQAALEAADRAVTKAEIATEKRFEAGNEFRQSLNDLIEGFRSSLNTISSTLLPRSEATVALGGLTEKLIVAVGRLDKLEGRDHGLSIAWAITIAVIAAAASAIGVILAVAK